MPDPDIASAFAQFPWSLFLIAALVAVGFVWMLIPVAHRVGWLDLPTARKEHVGQIPLIGGWALLLTLGLVQALLPEHREAPAGYWLGALLLFLISVIDDRFPIRARYRMLVHFGAAVAGVSFGGQALTGIGDLLGNGAMSGLALGMIVSVVGTVALINAVNFIDGADGLCGGLGFVALFWFVAAVLVAAARAAAFGHPEADHAPSLLPFAATMMGALAGFLAFNLRTPWRDRASIFLGDSGSMLIGFTIAWFAIHASSAYGGASVPPVVCLWIAAVPLADSASCIIRRLLNGIKPSTPDLKHLHHLLPRFGWTPGQAVALIHAGAFGCGLIGVGGWLLGMPEHWLFGLFVVVLTGFVLWTWVSWRRIDGRGAVRGQAAAGKAAGNAAAGRAEAARAEAARAAEAAKKDERRRGQGGGAIL